MKPNTILDALEEPTDDELMKYRKTRTVLGMDKLRRCTNALDPAVILKWKFALTTETCWIVSGQNAAGGYEKLPLITIPAQ